MKFLVLSGVLLLGACRTVPPQGYLPVDDGIYKDRFISPTGIVVGWRKIVPNEEGTLEFWSKVIRQELEASKGYVLKSEEPLGAGRQMIFSTPDDQKSYYLAIFMRTWDLLPIHQHWIQAVEAGGSQTDLEKDLPLIRDFATKL